MKNYDVIVVGGSAAGIPAAITAKRHYPDKNILLIRKDNNALIPCGIPYIFGTVGSPDKNLIPDGILAKNGIELMVDEVKSINREKRNVTTHTGKQMDYEKLILATGSEPTQLPIPGIEKKNVFSVKKDVSYLQAILDKLEGAKDVVILGGGFIGVEFADEFQKRGLNTTIVEMLPHCLMLTFEEELCKEAEEKLKSRGVKIITDTKIEEIKGKEAVESVRLSDGQELRADVLVIGVGVKPNTAIAQEAGLEVNRGGIVVDSHMKTTDPHIFACGDCATKRSFFTSKPSDIRLASTATTEARIAGANLFGPSRTCLGAIGVFSTAIGDLVQATCGLTKSRAEESGFTAVSGEAEAPDRHPGGMPGMSQMKVTLVFNKLTGEIIGGQVRGGPSAGELINTISACIQNKMTANDIATFQIGTHPAVTASPIAYQLVNAAEVAIQSMECL